MRAGSLIVIGGVALLVAFLGSILTNAGLTTWYITLQKPTWTPPGSVIGIAWTIIYILTAIAAWLVWQKSLRTSRLWWIVLLLVLNSLLNIFWTYLFFDQHLLGIAVIEMCLLNLTTVALIILMWPISELASFLLWPYVGWVTFATYLAYQIWQLNL